MNLTPAQIAALAKLAERGYLTNGSVRLSTVRVLAARRSLKAVAQGVRLARSL